MSTDQAVSSVGATLDQLADLAVDHDPMRVGPNVRLTDLDHDSRQASADVAFVAVPGLTVDGHDFVERAVAAGAPAVIAERSIDLDVPQLIVDDTRALLGAFAAAVHGHPARKMLTVGVTGTNGKTTVTHMMASMARSAGITPGVIGTIGARIGDEELSLGHTTPEATEVQRLLHRMTDASVGVALLEVSSHALLLGRVDGIQFDIAGFTNLSQDHLDFHGTMDAYFEAKADLFTPERAKQGVVFVHDGWGTQLVDVASVPVVAIGGSDEDGVDITLHDVVVSPTHSTFSLHDGDQTVGFEVPLGGDFNVHNAAIAVVVARKAGWPDLAIQEGLTGLGPVAGRYESIDVGQSFAVVVDYAHTPDALERAIASALDAAVGKVIALGGAGGDRDRGKRPLMGAALATADIAVITSDNPRSEDPEEIVAAMVAGVSGSPELIIEVDRHLAIRRALRLADPGDTVLILGRGHESMQDLGAEKIPFDDRMIARQELLAMQGEAT